MKLNKKSQIFEPLMVIFLTILLLFAVKYLVYDKAVERDRDYVGETSVKIVELDNEAKLTKFLIENTARYLYYKAIDETANQGGGCEDWSKDCELDAKKTFFQNFNNLFNNYIKGLNILTDYTYKEEDNKLKFESKGKLSFSSETTKTMAPAGVVYSIPHAFEIDFNYNFDIYKKYHNQFKEPKADCSTVPKEYKCSIANNYINIEIPTEDLVFVKPVIKFKLGILKKAQAE